MEGVPIAGLILECVPIAGLTLEGVPIAGLTLEGETITGIGVTWVPQSSDSIDVNKPICYGVQLSI